MLYSVVYVALRKCIVCRLNYTGYTTYPTFTILPGDDMVLKFTMIYNQTQNP